MKLFLFYVAFLTTVIVGPKANTAEYTVKEGETLSEIALKTGHTVNQLVVLNQLENPNRIKKGQRIIFISNNDLLEAKVVMIYGNQQMLADSTITDLMKKNMDKITADLLKIDKNYINYTDPLMINDKRPSCFQIINLADAFHKREMTYLILALDHERAICRILIKK